MKYSKVAAKLAIGTAVLIVLVESALLFFSIEKKRGDFTTLQMAESRAYGKNNVITKEFIKQELADFTKNVTLLTFFISFFVIVGNFYIYYTLVGKYITRITNHNRQNSPLARKTLLKNIPADEVGELILSREKMLTSLEEKIAENKTLTRMLVHDISNALTIAIGNTQSLLKNGENENAEYRQKKLEKIAMATAAQKNLIERVRDMEAASSHKQAVILKKENIHAIIKNTFYIFDEKLKAKNLKLSFQSNIPEDTTIKIDSVLFTNNVINNFISNAIKFSNENQTIEILLDKNANGNLTISIKDSGVGIPKNYIGNLFNPNIQTSREGTKGEKGTGFGLPLAHSTVALLGGKITVQSKTIEESPENHGTVFSIELGAI